MECRKQLCEKCKKKEDDYFLVTLNFPAPALQCQCKKTSRHERADAATKLISKSMCSHP